MRLVSTSPVRRRRSSPVRVENHRCTDENQPVILARFKFGWRDRSGPSRIPDALDCGSPPTLTQREQHARNPPVALVRLYYHSDGYAALSIRSSFQRFCYRTRYRFVNMDSRAGVPELAVIVTNGGQLIKRSPDESRALMSL